MPAPPALHFYDTKPITFDEAQDLEQDFVKLWAQDRALEQFYKRISRHKEEIKALTRHHLHLDDEEVVISPTSTWIHGTFNLCIPLQVRYNYAFREFIFRYPMPHKLAEAQYPGTVDKKMRCKVGAYVWMQENSPNVRIPYLYGFGFSDHRHFTHKGSDEDGDGSDEKTEPTKAASSQHTIASRYGVHPAGDINFPITYMLLECIRSDTGQMLLRTWKRYYNDLLHKDRLCKEEG